MPPTDTIGSSRLTVTEAAGLAHADAEGVTEPLIRAVVVEFYRRAREDDRLGPIFEARVQDWDWHLDRMTDFWSAALLRSGRYSGRPVEKHRPITDLTVEHFDRWVELFEATVNDVCEPAEAQAFMVRAHRMRDGMTKVLGLVPGLESVREYLARYAHYREASGRGDSC